jgi:hypothetical protein
VRLERHPASEGGEGLRLEAEVTRSGAALSITYRVSGDIGCVRLPPAARSERADGLWRHTCFEAFLLAADGGYYELNFAPSTRWAAYRFDGYRAGMAAAEVAPPKIEMSTTPEGFQLTARAKLDGCADLPPDVAWRLAIATVIEDFSGRISYWALAHPPGKPDFHHPDGFALVTDT